MVAIAVVTVLKIQMQTKCKDFFNSKKKLNCNLKTYRNAEKIADTSLKMKPEINFIVPTNVTIKNFEILKIFSFFVLFSIIDFTKSNLTLRKKNFFEKLLSNS